MDVIDRIFKLVDSKFKEQREFAAAIGVSEDTVSDWRRKKSESCTKAKYLARIAEVLETTTDYLSYGIQPESDQISQHEREILAAYRKADERAKEMVKVALKPFGLSDMSEKAI